MHRFSEEECKTITASTAIVCRQIKENFYKNVLHVLRCIMSGYTIENLFSDLIEIRTKKHGIRHKDSGAICSESEHRNVHITFL